ncbi:MAG TPA: response regulator transcription factor [Candidatus Angelobacter sp.]|nr:response regulator transcription factor [Candidatus Angelobacter sp.]
MRVLLAEDDAALRSALERGLTRSGYAVDSVATGEDVLLMLTHHDYAAAVLDWRMPQGTGIEALRTMRAAGSHLPVLMLTARDAAADRVEGLDSGADDYLIKPFDFDELLARLRALLRRPPQTAGPQLSVGGVVLDPATRVVSLAGRRLLVTPTEIAILELLMRRHPATVTRRAIAEHAWQDETDPIGSNTIDKHIARLRSKLDGAGVVLHTERGIGWRLVVR